MAMRLDFMPWRMPSIHRGSTVSYFDDRLRHAAVAVNSTACATDI